MNRKISHTLLVLLICVTLFNFLIHPHLCIEGATNGLLLWFNKVLPSLLPFIILTNILASLGGVMRLCRKLSPLTQKLLGLSGSSFFIFITGLIAGYPTGAKLTAQLLEQKDLSLPEAQKVLCFSNNCGPLFILGTVGTLLLNAPKLGYFLLSVHILSAFTLMILFRFYNTSCHTYGTHIHPSVSISNTSFATIFNHAVQNSMDTIVYVGGYIIFFSVLVNLLKHSSLLQNVFLFLSHLTLIDYSVLESTLLGSLELSTGMAIIAPLMQSSFSLSLLALIAGLIGFGGFCVYFQVLYFLEGFSLHTSLYLFSKALQAMLSVLYVYLLYPLFLSLTSNIPVTLPFLPFLILLIVLIISSMFLKVQSISVSFQRRL